MQVLVPCDGVSCCSQLYRVCKINGGLTFQALGNPVGGTPCQYSQFPDISEYPPPDAIGNCNPNCDYNQAVEPKGDEPNPRKPEIDQKNLDESNLNINISMSSDNRNMILKFESDKENNLTVLISDIKGVSIVSYNLELSKGTTSKEINVSSYISGSYLINVYSDDKLIKTEKVIINK